MSEENPNVDELKEAERLQVEIDIEEDQPPKAEVRDVDVIEELKGLGRQFAETIQTAWDSEERVRVENEIREGMRSFADEVDKVIREARESNVAHKVKEEATEVKTRVETADLGRKARGTVAQSLQWLSEELGKLAEQFTPIQKTDTAAAETPPAAGEETAE